MVASTTVNPTRLRENLYSLLDQVLDSGQPVAIERKGRVLLLSAQPSGSRVDRLHDHPGTIVGSPDELVSIDWSDRWNPGE